MKRISVFGLGYVGSVSAACLAKLGHQVIGVEVNAEKVEMINKGVSPVVEPDLRALLKRVVDRGNLRATTSHEEAVKDSDAAFICVGTPGDAHGQLQLDALVSVCRQIGEASRGRDSPYTVVIRSTVLPGTAQGAAWSALLQGAGRSGPLFKLAVNPEFLREGSAIEDFFNPPFTLVGCEDAGTAALLGAVYYEAIDAPMIQTSIKTAEMVKYVSNAYHALKVCFANEVGDACDAFGADAREVMRIFSMDKKLNVSDAYLKPGFAFGGSCLPKDLGALLYAAHHADVSVPVLDAIMPSNDMQIDHAVEAVLATGKRRIGVVGLSFKPGTDDLRESAMVSLVEKLIGKGRDIRIRDNNVSVARLIGSNRQYIQQEIPHIASLMCESTHELIDHAEVVVIGSVSDEALSVLAQCSSDQTIVDLTRGMVWERMEKQRSVA